MWNSECNKWAGEHLGSFAVWSSGSVKLHPVHSQRPMLLIHACVWHYRRRRLSQHHACVLSQSRSWWEKQTAETRSHSPPRTFALSRFSEEISCWYQSQISRHLRAGGAERHARVLRSGKVRKNANRMICAVCKSAASIISQTLHYSAPFSADISVFNHFPFKLHFVNHSSMWDLLINSSNGEKLPLSDVLPATLIEVHVLKALFLQRSWSCFQKCFRWM